VTTRGKLSPKPKAPRRSVAARPAPAPSPDPLTLPPDRLAGLLSRCGSGTVSAARIRADVKAGAPRRSGGALNVVEYAAWLLREAGRG
jgi:hypothetical protein